ncbi:hypothetical protein [Bacillus smithii]|uniref:hypothetical protein n=1 Tax=Bacillus smithii TaxID=1479 RepID=UPI002E1AFB01|nr:hypothetical protein [Bacillus smithii]MED4929187.1 hypothetical protein [Bacillus smithii]
MKVIGKWGEKMENNKETGKDKISYDNKSEVLVVFPDGETFEIHPVDASIESK